ncbi:MAG: hypothetical protein RTU92_02500 [Candidatus Thorarchaeota archaeon]
MSEDMPDLFRDIVLTPEGESPIKEVMFITDEKSARAFDHEARIAILTILARGTKDKSTSVQYDQESDVRTETTKKVVRTALSVIEIVKMSKKYDDVMSLTRNQIYHHFPVMIDSGIIVKHGTVQTGNRFTDYYRRTAISYVLTLETPDYGDDFLRKIESDNLDKLLSMFKLSLDNSQQKELLELRVKMQKLQDRWRPLIAKMAQDDVTDREIIRFYHWLLDIYSLKNPEYIELGKSIAKILFPEALEGQ